MKTWLKGGLIGGGIYLLLIIIHFVVVGLFSIYPFGGVVNLTYPGIYLARIIPCSEMGCLILLPFGAFFNLIFIFIIGAIVGLIVQKTEERKK